MQMAAFAVRQRRQRETESGAINRDNSKECALLKQRIPSRGTLTDQKALAYSSTLCNIQGGQGITCQPKNTTVSQRAPRK